MVLLQQNKPAGAGVKPRRHSDFRLAVFRTVERLCVLLGGRFVYRRLFLARGRLAVREERIEVPALPAELDGLTIVQLSDFHAGPFLARHDLSDVVAAVEALEPDLLVMTGDFVTHHWSEVRPILPDLGRFPARLGAFAVLGNHDYHDRAEQRIVDGLAEHGIRCLRNESAPVLDGALYVVGLEDLEESRCVDPAAARANVPEGALEILLCHNPMGAPRLARPGCVAIFSGHTHGTQIDLPVLRTMGPQHPGLRVDFGTTTLVVSRGVGVVGVPFRFRAPAEVVRATLVRG